MDFAWLNPPPRWSGDARALELETGAATDFWRETFYGFVRDSGHAWLAPVVGDFSLAVRFRGGYEALYDQAGLMLRQDDGGVDQDRGRVYRRGDAFQRGRHRARGRTGR